MTERVICQGCGQRITLPDDYRRNKIQCPECGVITAVDVAAGKPLGSGSRRRDDDTPFDTKRGPSQANAIAPPVPPPPRPRPEPEPDIASLPDVAPRREPEEPPAEPEVWTCSFCGEWQPRQPRGKKPRCPVCKTPVPTPSKTAGVTTEPQKALVPAPVVVQTDWSDDPEDSKPYRVDAAAQTLCPGCGKPMEPQAIVCLLCGFDLRKGERAKTAYDPIVRRWDAGLALHFRLLAFGVWQCVAIPPMLWGAAHEGHAPYAVVSWLWLSLMAAFLTGTFDRVDLNRGRNGKVRLVKTWYFCFIPRPPEVINLAQYEGIATGQVHELDVSDYIVLLAGIGFFLIPGIVWYVVFMQRDTWYVALTKDHGHPDLWLYRGWSEGRAKEIAETLRTAALPEYNWY
jgi:hypothetical protein